MTSSVLKLLISIFIFATPIRFEPFEKELKTKLKPVKTSVSGTVETIGIRSTIGDRFDVGDTQCICFLLVGKRNGDGVFGFFSSSEKNPGKEVFVPFTNDQIKKVLRYACYPYEYDIPKETVSEILVIKVSWTTPSGEYQEIYIASRPEQ